MARIYMAAGGYEKALPLLVNALEMNREADASDSEICGCLLDLAFVFRNQGRYADAETMCLKGLKLQEKINGSNHPHVAHTLRILSDIYQGQARYRRAAEVLERAISIMQKVTSENSGEIAPLKVDMARLLVVQGHYVRAESLFKEALISIEKSYGPKHAYTAKVITSMATLSIRQKRYDEAEELACEALDVLEKVYGADHHFLVPVWLVKSRAFQAGGEFARAKELLDRSLAVTSKRTNRRRFDQCDVLSRIGELHISCEDYHRAEKALQRTLEILEGSHDRSDRTAIVLNSLAKVRIQQGQHRRAKEQCHEALDILERIFDKYHPYIADVLDTLAESHRLNREDSEAGRLEKRAEQIRGQKRLAFVPKSNTVR